ncbi:MAG: SPOR domain-containing protein, partial [Crocinitomicaceae bacterium]|nr:SPOR domain-containing protein [Crocinitomicaceae bacterium]
KDWDPNALITGKPAPKAAAPADAASAVVPPEATPAPTAPPAVAADPIGALANAKAASATAAPTGQTSYYVQVGAFRVADDAQSQRAILHRSYLPEQHLWAKSLRGVYGVRCAQSQTMLVDLVLKCNHPDQAKPVQP